METLIIQVICQLESKFHFSYIWILHLVFAASFLSCSDEERMIAISSEDYWGIMIFAGVIFLNTAQNMYILLCLWWYGMYITHCLYTQFDQRNSFKVLEYSCLIFLGFFISHCGVLLFISQNAKQKTFNS